MKVFLDAIGCRLNQAEIESLARQLRAAGHEIVSGAETAELAVVNTCTVTAAAASDSRAAIRRAARMGAREIIATGCWATLQPDQAAALPSVVRVVPNHSKEKLVSTAVSMGRHMSDLEPIGREQLPAGLRRTRAFIKVQDGCNNRCAFCVTTIARGPGRSRSIADVLADVEWALMGGAHEIVLTGVHLGSWGRDLGLQVRDLVAAVLCHTDVPRLRLSSLEPWDLEDGFFSLWEDSRLCRHLHLPLQSGCAATLRRMGRKTTPHAFRDLVALARGAVPGVAITTDVIAGFPGETEQEFCASLNFVRGLELAGGHAFTFSPMEGTAAARLDAHVPIHVRRGRTRQYVELFEQAGQAFRRKHMGEVSKVLWESCSDQGGQAWLLSGLTDNYLRVRARSERPRWNSIDEVELTGMDGTSLKGIIRKTG